MRIYLILFSIFIVSCSNSVNSVKNDEVADEDVFSDSDLVDDDSEDNGLLLDLKVEENPENVLSCRLMFRTTDKTTAIVRYYSDTHSGYELKDEDSDDHYFFLWGMRADTKYRIDIFLGDNDTDPVRTTEFTTGQLPDYVPEMILEQNVSEKVSDGFALFTYYYIPAENSVPVILMLDTDGEVVWYFEYFMEGFSIIGDVQYMEETETILIGLEKGPNMIDIPAEEAIEIDIEGNVLWRSKKQSNVYGDERSWHHIYELLENDTIVMLRREFIDNVICDIIVNVDRNYNELWRWHYRDHFEIPESDPLEEFNWTHGNSVSMFPEDKVVYLNSRDQAQFYKIDMETGDIIWTFGKAGDFTMLTDHPDPWFELAHDPEIMTYDGKEILLYDNGTPERGYSRVMKYRIDDVNMTAEVIFEFDGSKENKKWYTEYWGDADELSNGNVFITIGEFEEGDLSKLMEITDQGEIVWELLFPETGEMKVSLYNAQKFVPELMK